MKIIKICIKINFTDVNILITSLNFLQKKLDFNNKCETKVLFCNQQLFFILTLTMY